MSGWTLRSRGALGGHGLRVDLSTLLPSALAALSRGEVERLPLGDAPLAERFDVQPRTDDTLVLEGDCSRADRIGWQLDAGTLIVDGRAGHYVGALMRGGTLHVRGDAGDLAACELAGGTLTIDGSVGDFAAAPRAGGMDGMRGGTLVIGGDAGARLADRMRRGVVVLHGNAGDFAASRMVAGTLALGGRCGAHPGYGMRRGSLVFATQAPAPPPTFTRVFDLAPVAWQLIARDLARHGGAFENLPARTVAQRWRGDRAAQGHGEWIAVAP